MTPPTKMVSYQKHQIQIKKHNKVPLTIPMMVSSDGMVSFCGVFKLYLTKLSDKTKPSATAATAPISPPPQNLACS